MGTWCERFLECSVVGVRCLFKTFLIMQTLLGLGACSTSPFYSQHCRHPNRPRQVELAFSTESLHPHAAVLITTEHSHKSGTIRMIQPTQTEDTPEHFCVQVTASSQNA
jgi:hypothetical protein